MHLITCLLFGAILSADDFFEATLWEKAIPLYEEQGIVSDNYLWSLYFAKEYQTLNEKIGTPKNDEERRLKGLSLMHLGKEQDALPYLDTTPSHQGIAHFRLKQYDKALECFEKTNLSSWKIRTLIALKRTAEAETHLSKEPPGNEREHLFGLLFVKKGNLAKAIKAFKREGNSLFMGEAYLLEGKHLNKAKEALLKAFQEHPSDRPFDGLVRIAQLEGNSSFLEQLDLEKISDEALLHGAKLLASDSLLKVGEKRAGFLPFKKERGRLALKRGDLETGTLCFGQCEDHESRKLLAECYFKRMDQKGLQEAISLLSNFDDQDACFKRALASCHLALIDKASLGQASEIVDHYVADFPEDPKGHELKGALLEDGDKDAFMEFLAGLEGAKYLLKKASLASDPHEREALYKEVLCHYPDAPEAAAAYFKLYSWNDYLFGGKKALLHLEKMEALYPNSPYLVAANFLMGLSKAKEESEWLEAIARFQKAETLFKTLSQQDQVQFASISNQAHVEKGRISLEIARTSEGAKRSVYLKSTKEIFQGTSDDDIYYRAFADLELGNTEGARKGVELLENLSFKTHLLLAKICDRENHLDDAERAIDKALSATTFGAERIEGLLFKAEIQEKKGMLDEAMLSLSQAINTSAYSSLRIQAMVRRAEVYRKQGRTELSKKQLVAAAKFKGPWGKIAQQKLEEDHG